MPLFKRSNDITNTRASSSSPERRGIFSRSHRTNDNNHHTRASSSSPDNNHHDRASSSLSDRKKSIFRRASTSPSETGTQNNNKRTHRSGTGIFGHRRRTKSGSIDHDPSIIEARQKVSDAEQAEKEADRALMEARNHVQVARDHVRTLEQEAIEEARIAKLKQAEAKVIQKSAKSLGRHGP